MRKPRSLSWFWHFVAIAGIVLHLVACVAVKPAARGSGLPHEVFPTASRIEAIAAEQGCLWRCDVSKVHDKDGNILGYTITQRLTSRSGQFTTAIHVSPDMRIMRAEVLTYNRERGSEVRSADFSRQFVDKGVDDPLQIGKDLDAVTGATMSCSAMADGVRHALRLLRDIRAEGRAGTYFERREN